MEKATSIVADSTFFTLINTLRIAIAASCLSHLHISSCLLESNANLYILAPTKNYVFLSESSALGTCPVIPRESRFDITNAFNSKPTCLPEPASLCEKLPLVWWILRGAMQRRPSRLRQLLAGPGQQLLLRHGPAEFSLVVPYVMHQQWM